MEILLSLDAQLFLLFNHLPHNQTLDSVGRFLSVVSPERVIWAPIAAWFFIKTRGALRRFFFPLLLTLIVSWVSAELVKIVVARSRPSEAMGAIVIGSDQVDFSFPSAHATVAFALAVALSAVEPKWKRRFYLLATAIGVSRMYLGYHYPLDVLGGAILGVTVGTIVLDGVRRPWGFLGDSKAPRHPSRGLLRRRDSLTEK